MGLTRDPCPCGTLRPSRRHGRVPAAWLDTRDGATVRVEAEVGRLFCPACKATRTGRPPGLHPTRDMTTALVAVVMRHAALTSCQAAAELNGVHRQAVSALVDEALAAFASGDLPGDVAMHASPGAGGALLAVNLHGGEVLDAFHGARDPRLTAFLDREPSPALHCDWVAAVALRGHPAAEGRVSVPAAARSAWLASVLPRCDEAFASGRPRRAAPGMRAALALGSRHPLSLSIPEAAALRQAGAADPALRLYLGTRRTLASAVGREGPAAAGEAYGRWLAAAHPAMLSFLSGATVPLGRMADTVFAGDGEADPDAWLSATSVCLPGLSRANTRLALLRHHLDA